MEDMKHTPGPWEYQPDGHNFDGIGPADGDGSWICRIPRLDANARLIIAAPDLLAAAELMMELPSDLEIPFAMARPYMDLRDAVNKAKSRHTPTP